MALLGSRAPTDQEFADLVHATWPSLYRTALLLTGDHGHAEDLAQGALAATYSRWSGLRDPAAAGAYARRALVNAHASWWRRPSNREERPAREVSERVDLLAALAQLPPRSDSDRIADTTSRATTASAAYASKGAWLIDGEALVGDARFTLGNDTTYLVQSAVGVLAKVGGEEDARWVLLRPDGTRRTVDSIDPEAYFLHADINATTVAWGGWEGDRLQLHVRDAATGDVLADVTLPLPAGTADPGSGMPASVAITGDLAFIQADGSPAFQVAWRTGEVTRVDSVPEARGGRALRVDGDVGTVVDLASGRTVGTVDLPGEVDTPLLSPDGEYVAYARTDTSPFAVFVQPVGGGPAVRLENADFAKAWTPDGHVIAARLGDTGQVTCTVAGVCVEKDSGEPLAQPADFMVVG